MSLSERLKIAMKEAGVSQAELARACKVKPPSIHGWLSGKSKFLRGENLLAAARALQVSQDWLATGRGTMRATAELRDGYFAAEPSTEEYAQSTEGPLSFAEIEKIIFKVISNNAKGIPNAADIAQEAARKILARGGATGSVSGQFIFASPEEIELLELFKKTNPSGRKSILNAVRGIQAGEPVAENVESFPLQRSAKLRHGN